MKQVKIVSCRDWHYWYRDLIGKVALVKSEPFVSNNGNIVYSVVNGDLIGYNTILVSDVRDMSCDL